MDLDSLTYLFAPHNANIMTTKGAIEVYVRQRICDYLDGIVCSDNFQREYDGSGYDMAIENVREYIDDAIIDLRDEIEDISNEGGKE